ncbi:MAG: hypothetical protein ACK5MA_01070 [Parachlamydiaceae bacterium]
MSLQVPREDLLEKIIANTPVLKTAFFENRGVTQAIAKLAREKFAGGDLVDLFAKLAAADLVNELRPKKFGDEELADIVWQQALRATEQAFKNALNQNKVTYK